MSIINFIIIALFAVGLFFIVVAAIGFCRLPDLYCRMHVTGILDTFGVPVVLLGLTVYNLANGEVITAGKLMLMIIFLYLTSPLIGHLLGRAALEFGYAPVLPENLAGKSEDTGAKPGQSGGAEAVEKGTPQP